MIHEILFTHSGEIGLALFVLVFVGTTLWALTRTRQQVNDWSNLPLGGSEPSQPANRE